MSWTDERVALLKKLWGEGKTAAEIAQALGGVTRNAVIGKAHRLKLSNRVSPIQQNKKTVIPAAPKIERKIAAPVFDENKKCVDMMSLGPRSCRWPHGDPREEKFGFCGDAIVPGLPYCARACKSRLPDCGPSRAAGGGFRGKDHRCSRGSCRAGKQNSREPVKRVTGAFRTDRRKAVFL